MVKSMDLFNKLSKYLLPLVLCGWCVVLLAQKIDLPLADIGRHIKNGEIILHGSWADKHGVLYSNFYSYTEPNQSFVNHHWLSGVIFYLVHQFAGFKGLSVFYIAIVSLAFFLFYHIAQKRAGSAIASILAVLVLPIIASRTEIRPEGFTYLLMGVFFWVLNNYFYPSLALSPSAGRELKEDSPPLPVRRNFSGGGRGGIRGGWLWFLPILMLFWVNLHIGFIFGFLILAAFWLDALIKVLTLRLRSGRGFKIKDKNYRFFSFKLRLLTITGVLCFLAGLVNPFFVKGLLYPLNIFRQYGYLIVENQSVMFLQKLGLGSSLYFGLFKFLLGLGVLTFIIKWIKNYNLSPQYHSVRGKLNPSPRPSTMSPGPNGRGREGNAGEFLLLGTAGILAFFAIRNFSVFGLLFLPIVAGNIKDILPTVKHPAYKLLPAIIAITIIIFGSFRFWENYKFKQAAFGTGLMPGVEAAAEFFKREKITGPIFNNYDIGGYLIYELFDLSKPSPALRVSSPLKGEENMKRAIVFTDNRPEAYSLDHFQKDYIPAQQDNVQWEKLDARYNFNAIFFSHRDLTPWGQAFLIFKVSDNEWAPVFADQYNIIFVKKNSGNAELIKKYLIPKENFRVIPNQTLN